MKKIYPLVLALLVGAAAVAAERPRFGMITISIKENFDVRVSYKCIASITVVTPSTYSAAIVINYFGAIPFT